MITLNHTIVPVQDKEAAAQLFADLFDLEVGRKSPGSPPGRFAVVRVGETNFDSDDREEFDAILERVICVGALGSLVELFCQ